MTRLSRIVLLVPSRILLVLVYLTSDYVQHVHRGLLLPLIAFLYLPLTILAYAFMVAWGQSDTGLGFVVVMIYMVIDMASLAASTVLRDREHGAPWHAETRQATDLRGPNRV